MTPEGLMFMSISGETTLKNSGNLFQTEIPEEGEVFHTLLEHKNIKIERIVSAPPIPDRTFVQGQDEWVLLVRGGATLEVEGAVTKLNPGDYLFIPSGQRHKVLEAKAGTLWLAVHIF
jgi:cupin 2 domain-containing protein